MTDHLNALKSEADNYHSGCYQNEPGCVLVSIGDVEAAIEDIEDAACLRKRMVAVSRLAEFIGWYWGGPATIPASTIRCSNVK